MVLAANAHYVSLNMLYHYFNSKDKKCQLFTLETNISISNSLLVWFELISFGYFTTKRLGAHF